MIWRGEAEFDLLSGTSIAYRGGEKVFVSKPLVYPSDIVSKWGEVPIGIYRKRYSDGRVTQGKVAQYASDFLSVDWIPFAENVAYTSPSASPGGLGTKDNPRRLTELLADNTIGQIILQPGEYNNLWGATANRDLSLICPGGKAVLTNYETDVKWNAAGGSYLAVRESDDSTIENLISAKDFSTLSAFDGIYVGPRQLTRYAVSGDVASNPGSYYIGGTGAILVNPFDGQSPSEAIRIYKNSPVAEIAPVAANYYFEAIEFVGGSEAFKYQADELSTVTFYRCGFVDSGSSAGGLSAVNGRCIAVECYAYNNYGDGLDYDRTTGEMLVYEEGCIGRFNGINPGAAGANTHNGSTFHSGGAIMRLNCIYEENQDRQTHDVNSGVISFNVACIAGKPREAATEENSASFSFGRSGQTDATNAWLIDCISTGGGLHDLQVYPGSTATLIDSSFESILEQGTIDRQPAIGV